MTSFTLTSAGTHAAIRAKDKAVALKFTSIAIGNEVGDTQNLKERTKLKKELQKVAINAAAHNKAKDKDGKEIDQLEINVLIPFPKGRKDGFEVKEVGIYVEDPNDQMKEKLALIHSSDTAIARRSVDEDLFLSIAIKLEGSDLTGVTIHEPTTDYSLLLKSTFDKYVLKANIVKTFDVQVEDNLVSSYELSNELDGRLKKIEAKEKALKLGSFPKYFAPADTKKGDREYNVPNQVNYIIQAPNSNGHYEFAGGKFYIFGKTYDVGSFTTDNQFVKHTYNNNKFTKTETAELIGSLPNVNVGDKVYILLNVSYEKTQAEGLTFADELEFQVTKSFKEEDINKKLDEAPTNTEGKISIKLAEFTKGADWNITSANLKNEDLLEKYATLIINPAKAIYQHFEPKSHYVLKLSDKDKLREGSIIRLETKGNAGAVRHCEWEGMPRAVRTLNATASSQDVTFEIFIDNDKTLSVSLIPDEKATQIGWSPIGSIVAWHKNLKKTTNREVGLKLPPGWVECNGQEAYLLDGTKVTVPKLNDSTYSTSQRGFFLRGHTTSGLFERDALQGHNHYYYKASKNVVAYHRSFSNKYRGSTSGHDSGLTTSTGGVLGARSTNETRPINMSVVWIMRIF